MNLHRRFSHWLKALDLLVHGFISINCETTFSASFVHCEHGRGCSWALSRESWRLR